MDLDDQRYIIGIDLGTTNSAVSYVDLHAEGSGGARIQLFPISQLTGPGEVSRLPVLPSFLYIPGDYDISKQSLVHEWGCHGDNFAGAYARDHGAKVPARLVSSAKSWLCHANADRKAPILPWGASKEVRKISPIHATAAYLRHIRRAWNRRQSDEEAFLEYQMVIITVPASFDEVAREMTLEAAGLAGMGDDVILLEEPLAAFYSWLMTHEHDWNRFVEPNDLILICDVGGGTTDFTLIYLREVDGSPRFERIAVGDHLILGGDNMDLALARRLEVQFFENKHSLSGDRWKTLCHQCRQAKETLLDGRADSQKIALMGEGGQLIAGTLTASLGHREVTKTILNGFFPLVDPSEKKPRANRKGITEFGLPYEQEPAITRHLCWFLEQHSSDVDVFLQKDRPEPDIILFNGGSLKPVVIQERIRGAIRQWFGQPDDTLPRVLDNPDPDLSVAMGAAYYGRVKMGQGVRVGSGSPRAFYLGVADPEEARNQKNGKQAICLVERGLEEGTDIELKDRQFEVLTNRPVTFDMYSSSFRSGDRCGDLVAIDDSLTPLPPIQTIIQYGKKGAQTRIPIHIAASYTEMGALALWCRSLVSTHRWHLQFQLRKVSVPATVADQEVFESSVVDDVRELVREAFADGASDTLRISLARDISKHVERPKEQWPLTFIRRMADDLIELESVRTGSAVSESRWLNFLGFCMRPGFADSLDPIRMKKIWQIYIQGMCHPNHLQVQSEWWIMWRRVAGGLKPGQQRQFFQDLTPVLFPGKGVRKKAPPQQRLEIWMAAANMEHLLAKDKIKCGRALLAEIKLKKSRPHHFWALSRMGARELLYGSVDRVIPAKEAAAWIETLISINWRNPRPIGAAIAQLARKTGDRGRDLGHAHLERVMAWMTQDPHREQLLRPNIRYLKEVVPMAKQEESDIFGESLPAGIVLQTG
ncbi:MAG: hsp70 family protein [Deltaproteobacteria bacterium]|nr:hsp70 family protein [Deltaproteobacteria bacterium]